MTRLVRRLAGTRAAALLLVLLAATAAGVIAWQSGRADASPSPSPSASRSSASPSASPSSSPVPAASPSPAVTLKLGWTETPVSLNPFMGSGTSQEIWRLNYDSLVGVGPDGLPSQDTGLAESWQSSADQKTWKFRLRPGVLWQDGKACKAADVAFTFNFIIDNGLKGSVELQDVDRAEAVNDLTVKLHCSRPKADMLQALTSVFVLPKHVWKDVSAKKATTTFVNERPIVGTGPYQTVKFQVGGYIRMLRNPHYWGTEPDVEELIFLSYSNSDDMVQDLKHGTIDGAEAVKPESFKQLAGTAGVKRVAYPLYNWEYVAINCFDGESSGGDPVLKDAKFRRAIAWAIDRQACADVWDGFATPGYGIYPKEGWPASFDPYFQPGPDATIGFDLAKARQLLDEAGYKDTNDDGVREYKGKHIVLRLWAQDGASQNEDQADLIAGWLRDVGLKVKYTKMSELDIQQRMHHVKLVVVPPVLPTLPAGAGPAAAAAAAAAAAQAKPVIKPVFAPDYDLVVRSATGSNDPGVTATWYTSDQIGGLNDLAWSNKDYDDLCERQARAVDPQTRLDRLSEMQQLMYAKQPMIVLDYPSRLQVVDTAGWQGWQPFVQASVWHNYLDRQSYLALSPQAVVTESRTISAALIGWIVAGVLAVVALVLVGGFVGKRRQRAFDARWEAEQVAVQEAGEA
jgi:peptide/nickel transport system substrate-binding protein